MKPSPGKILLVTEVVKSFNPFLMHCLRRWNFLFVQFSGSQRRWSIVSVEKCKRMQILTATSPVLPSPRLLDLFFFCFLPSIPMINFLALFPNMIATEDDEFDSIEGATEGKVCVSFSLFRVFYSTFCLECRYLGLWYFYSFKKNYW